MRGEMTHMEYMERAKHFGNHIDLDRDDLVVVHALWTLWWDDPKVEEHKIAVRPERWQEMERTLAFLESDLIQRRVVQEGLNVWMRVRIVALFLTLSVLLLLVARLWLSSYWLFAAMWIGMGVIGALIGGLSARWQSSRRAEVNKFAPFRDEAQWQAHQHRLQRFALPAYDPAVHGQMPSRPRLSAKEWTKQIVYTVPAALVLAVMAAIVAPIGVFAIMSESPEPSELIVDAGESDN